MLLSRVFNLVINRLAVSPDHAQGRLTPGTACVPPASHTRN
jgi:hypothetical protein